MPVPSFAIADDCILFESAHSGLQALLDASYNCFDRIEFLLEVWKHPVPPYLALLQR